jgi:hypothetical protein
MIVTIAIVLVLSGLAGGGGWVVGGIHCAAGCC